MDPTGPPGNPQYQTPSSSLVTLPVDSLGRLMEPSSGRVSGPGHDHREGGPTGEAQGRGSDEFHSTHFYSPHARPWEINNARQEYRPATDARHYSARTWERSFPPVETALPGVDRLSSHGRSQEYSPTDVHMYGQTPASYPGSTHGLYSPANAPPYHHTEPAPHPINQQPMPAGAPYDSANVPYHHPVRSTHDADMRHSTSLRPGSVPWNYAYPPAAPPRSSGVDYYADQYGHPQQRTVDPSLPSIPPPFRTPPEGYEGQYVRDGPSFASSLSPNQSSGGDLLGIDQKKRRTSMEGGTSGRKVAMPTSRLGLDPVAKQERRREQNRLAQRAFRARAKMREQEKNNEDAE